MTGTPIERDIARHVDELRRRDGEYVPVERIADVVIDLLGRLEPQRDLKLYQELDSLAGYIRDIKAEVAALSPGEVQAHYLPTATDELDAIVEATETAANAILAAAETIEDVAATAEPAVADKLTEVTTSIYEACSFQDITGQRIGKIVKALKVVQERVDGLVAAFATVPHEAAPRRDEATGDAALLNGPQLGLDPASRQSEIDALFSSAD